MSVQLLKVRAENPGIGHKEAFIVATAGWSLLTGWFSHHMIAFVILELPLLLQVFPQSQNSPASYRC